MSNENGKSDVQCKIEQIIREEIRKDNGYEEKNRNLHIGNIQYEPDFYFWDEKNNKNIIGEIYAHVGALKDGQKRKIAKDCLKLIAFEKHYNELETLEKQIICVDESVEKYLNGKSWLAETFNSFDIKVIIYKELKEDHKQEIEKAQNTQAKGNY
jgi:hypothetical protein